MNQAQQQNRHQSTPMSTQHHQQNYPKSYKHSDYKEINQAHVKEQKKETTAMSKEKLSSPTKTRTSKASIIIPHQCPHEKKNCALPSEKIEIDPPDLIKTQNSQQTTRTSSKNKHKQKKAK